MDQLNLSSWWAATSKAIEEQKEIIASLDATVAECNSLCEMIYNLPAKTHHQILVPFGGVAFMPGYLCRTNELIVHLGAGNFAVRSATQTTDILHRRSGHIGEQIASCREQVRQLQEKLRLAGSLTADEGGFVEIKEEYDPSVHGSSAARDGGLGGVAPAGGRGPRGCRAEAPADGELEAMMARMEALARIEEESGEVAPPGPDAGSGTAVEGIPPGVRLQMEQLESIPEAEGSDSDDDPEYDPAPPPSGPIGPRGGSGAEEASTASGASVIGGVVERDPGRSAPDTPSEREHSPPKAPAGGEPAAPEPKKLSRFKQMRKQ